MPKITFVSHDGKQTDVEADAGVSVMQTAVDNNISGIDGDCGGYCACATCHVYVADEWFEKVGGPGADEARLLGFASISDSNSRLACQIEMSEALDGLIVRLPEAQH